VHFALITERCGHAGGGGLLRFTCAYTNMEDASSLEQPAHLKPSRKKKDSAWGRKEQATSWPPVAFPWRWREQTCDFCL